MSLHWLKIFFLKSIAIILAIIGGGWVLYWGVVFVMSNDSSSVYYRHGGPESIITFPGIILIVISVLIFNKLSKSKK